LVPANTDEAEPKKSKAPRTIFVLPSIFILTIGSDRYLFRPKSTSHQLETAEGFPKLAVIKSDSTNLTSQNGTMNKEGENAC
jgi:hypothetical protein